MKLLLVLLCLIAVEAGVTRREATCDGPIVDGVHYTKHILKADIDRPYLLSSDYATDTLYFSYSADADDNQFKTAKLNLINNEFTDIDGVANGFAQSVDATTSDVYIGGSNGIFKYNRNNNRAEYFAANGSNIWMLYFKGDLYFTAYPSQFLYVIVEGEVSRFKDLEDTKVDQFVIDNDNNLFFTNGTGLYSQKMGTKNAVFYEGTDSLFVRGLTTDGTGKVFACLQDGIYALNKQDHVLKKILLVDDAFGVAFDSKNNIIYSDETSLVTLKPSKDNNCV